jgi:hypothetical protein
MIANPMKTRLTFVAATVAIAMLTGTGAAQAATAPVKEVLTAYFGAKVNKTTGANVCSVNETCQPAEVSSMPGGFEYPDDVAGAPNGNVYVADRGNARIQELEADGKFVLMFGREVNANKTNVCLAGETCKAGVEGTAAGQLVHPNAVAVDRVDEYTSGGQFVLMFGRDVNKTKEKEGAPQAERNVCTAASGNECQAGKGGTEHGALVGPVVIAVGPNPAKPAENLLYVGEEHRVQEFKPDGTWVGEISLTSISSAEGADVRSLVVDQAANVYLFYGVGNVSNVREFDSSGTEVKDGRFPLTLVPRSANLAPFSIGAALALSSTGRLAVSEAEETKNAFVPFGSLYDTSTAQLITEFNLPTVSLGMAFNGNDELYAQTLSPPEIFAFKPRIAATLKTSEADCVAGAEHESDVTLDCTLKGSVDAWGVKETEVWFEWGRTPALGQRTPKQPVANEKLNEGEQELPVSVSSVVGVRPNETFYDRMAGENHNVKAPEVLSSHPTVSFKTSTVAPRVLSELSAPFVTASSAVMFGGLNPENAPTKYAFQYGACENLESCAPLAETTTRESAAYGEIGASGEATGLLPETTYGYRLVAVNEKGEAAVNETGGTALPAGTFTTGPAPAPRAATGAASAIGTTAATISGMVDPDGQPATYAFEFGVSKGAETRYGVVFSGPAGAGTVPVEETFALSGLQPGTEYAYRITIKSGFGEARGTALTFTTGGLPTVLSLPSVLAQLPVPLVAFPVAQAKVKPKRITAAQRLASALRACKKKPIGRRLSCNRAARKKYGAKPRQKK